MHMVCALRALKPSRRVTPIPKCTNWWRLHLSSSKAYIHIVVDTFLPKDLVPDQEHLSIQSTTPKRSPAPPIYPPAFPHPLHACSGGGVAGIYVIAARTAMSDAGQTVHTHQHTHQHTHPVNTISLFLPADERPYRGPSPHLLHAHAPVPTYSLSPLPCPPLTVHQCMQRRRRGRYLRRRRPHCNRRRRADGGRDKRGHGATPAPSRQ